MMTIMEEIILKNFDKPDEIRKFDKEKYEKLREKYHANGKFMDVYDKITYRSESKNRKIKTIRSQLFTFFGRRYLEQINKNNFELI